MNAAGFDWLNIAGLKSDSELPPPPVSFGLTPTSSSSSLNLTQQKEAARSKSANSSLTNLAREPSSQDLSVPLSLRTDQLTRDEAKTYLRWYNDIVVRRGTNVIRLDDVFNFLHNFNLSQQDRELLSKIFNEINSLNIGEFFALLRVISHTIMGKRPSRGLIQEPAPIPKPKSILSAKRLQDSTEEDDDLQSSAPQDSKFDLDSFTQMLLTGEGPKKKKKAGKAKRIKFSDQVSVEPSQTKPVEPVKIDLSLPMDQLLNKLPKKDYHNNTEQQSVNEEEELKEMQDSFSHFQNVKNVDSALIHGTPANIPSTFFEQMTSDSPSGVMSPNPVQSPSPDPSIKPLAPNHTGPVPGLLAPNHTGPVPFANGLLQSSLTGGNTQSNGYLSPNYTGMVDAPKPLAPSMTGSLSNSMRLQQQPQYLQPDNRIQSASPNNRNLTPPVPPQRRARSASSPISFDPQHNTTTTLEQFAQATLPDRTTSPNTSSTPPVPPPPRRRGVSQSSVPPPPPSRNSQDPPALPPKISINNEPYYNQGNPQQYNQAIYDFHATHNDTHLGHHPNASTSTADILGDLQALQSEVDRLQLYQK